MSRGITIAAIQMDATPAPTVHRLARAERLVDAAAQAGAQLVVLPEIFNTGYGYTSQNYRRAEPLNGPTGQWMRETAAYYQIHLAGSLMLLDGQEIYNALLLFAPDGQMWRYDKNYPWGWERAYFRPGHGLTMAHTELGDIGLMICWDVAHPRLWRQYAGRVDLILIASCPPDVTNPTYHFPNGDQFRLDDLGPLAASLKGRGRQVFGDMLNRQTAWLGIPAVNTVGTGRLRTTIPSGRLSILAMLPGAPWLGRYLPQANRLELTCDFIQGCKIVDATGQVLAELPQTEGETFTVAEVILAGRRSAPAGPQPKSSLPRLSYVLSDALLPALMVPVYRRGLRRVWGPQLASSRLGAFGLGDVSGENIER